MKKKINKNSGLVYSTHPTDEIHEEQETVQQSLKGQTAYLACDRKGRRGKSVTLISGLNFNLVALKKDLQRLCGSGGSVKKDIIEIQGDHRSRIAEWLEKKGVRVKYKGG